MKTETQLISIITHLVTGHDWNLTKSIQSIDFLAYSIVFQRVGGSWGVWSQGAFIPLSEDHGTAVKLAVEWGLDEGRFCRLIDKINAL